MNSRILILEDDELLADLLRRKLVREGAVVELSATAEGALERVIQSPQIDLLIIDYRLSGSTNGIEFFEKALTLGWRGGAVLITGYLDEQIVLHALRAGVDDVYPKTPDFFDHLIKAVKRLVNIASQQKELEILRRERELLERTRESYTSAELLSWYWAKNFPTVIETSGAMLLQGYGLPSDSRVVIDHLRNAFSKKEWRTLLKKLLKSRGSEEGFEIDWSHGSNGTPRSWLIRGRWHSNNSISGVAIDVTDRVVMENQIRDALADSKRLNERLQFSISETHHRVKNSLQLVNSLLAIEFRKADLNVSQPSVSRIMTEVRALALLHDRLTDVLKDGSDRSAINLPEFIRDICGLILGTDCRITTLQDTILGTPRQASSLAIVMTEILCRIPKDLVQSIDWCRRDEETVIDMRFGDWETVELLNNALASITDNQLIKTIIKCDFNSQIECQTLDKSSIKCTIPISGIERIEQVIGAYQ